MSSERRDVFLFPLGTVLFPGGALPLKIFEQRYLNMTKACLRDNLPFGVCLIREGREVGDTALPESVGCLANIERWEMPHTGMFHLLARGGERFQILDTRVSPNGLLSGAVEVLPPLQPSAPDADCVALLERVIAQVGPEHFPPPIRLDDAAWVAYRVAEMLSQNLQPQVRQRMLQAEHADDLMAILKKYLKTNT